MIIAYIKLSLGKYIYSSVLTHSITKIYVNNFQLIDLEISGKIASILKFGDKDVSLDNFIKFHRVDDNLYTNTFKPHLSWR